MKQGFRDKYLKSLPAENLSLFNDILGALNAAFVGKVYNSSMSLALTLDGVLCSAYPQEKAIQTAMLSTFIEHGHSNLT